MKFYKRDPDRALSGMAELSFEQRGAYNSLLDLLYSRDGDVPDDDERVARMLSCNKREWARLKRSLIELGKVWVKDGKIGARRVQETINEATEFSNKQRANVSQRWAKSEKPLQNNDAPVPHGNATPSQSGNTLTPTATPTATPRTPPDGGVGDTPGRELFKRVEAALFAVPGVKGTNLELAPLAPVLELVRQGYDLDAEIIPVVKGDLAKATNLTRRKLSWNPIAARVRENRERMQQSKTSYSPRPDEQAEASWEERLFLARARKVWDTPKWGPYPHQPGCLVPAALLRPEDGEGWTEWSQRKTA